MARAPRVSVIVATWHRPAVLALTLRSILAQTMGDLQVEVVGDHCTDETFETVRGLGDRRLNWQNLVRRCGSQGWPNNAGLRAASGEWVAYCNHDDLWLPWWLEAGLAAAADGQTVVHGLGARFRPDGSAGLQSGSPLPGGGLYLQPSALLHRRELVARYGDWPHFRTSRLGVDADFTQRLTRQEPLAACARLSVLRFPANEFAAYQAGSAPPQERWLESLLSDPAAVESAVGRLLVADEAQRRLAAPTIGDAWRGLRQALAGQVGRCWGDRWPRPGLQRRQQLRRWLHQNERRGLPPPDLTGPLLAAEVSERWSGAAEPDAGPA
ncbi:MAG: glycosyltransferase [Fimbriimonadaceae bacterium]|nr:glycosyltransferase [Fimbriimonadaceae bacterium]